MKKVLVATLILLACASSAWSLSIKVGSTDVGGLDTLLASAKLKNSGDATELNWVVKELGLLGYSNSGITMEAKDENGDMKWDKTNQKGIYAIDFTTYQPEYFLVKTGNVQTTSYDHFLFLNNDSLDWGVINLGSLGIVSVTGIGKISHVDEFNSAGAPVPEPATLLMLGSGLLGLAGFRKKVK